MHEYALLEFVSLLSRILHRTVDLHPTSNRRVPMHRIQHHAMRASLVLCALAPAVQAEERSLDGVNFTGPLITPNPAGLPQGNWYIEPYLVRVDSRDHYDNSGDRRRSAEHSGAWATVVPIIYGFSDRVMGQVNLSASRAEQAARAAAASVPVTPPRACSTCCRRRMPMAPVRPSRSRWCSVSAPAAMTASPAIRLMRRATVCSAPPRRVGVQQVVWLGNDRPCAGAPAQRRAGTVAHGHFRASVYGTDDSFQGHISRGSVLGLSVGAEYSFNPRWVGVMEVAASRETGQRLRVSRNASGAIERIDEHRPASRSVTWRRPWSTTSARHWA
jgi:hypothetical protein